MNSLAQPLILPDTFYLSPGNKTPVEAVRGKGESFFMKIKKIFSVFLVQMAMVAALACGGCASARHAETTSMLSAAGFTTMTPRTPEQQANFAALPPYEVLRHDMNGRVTYVYADKRNGIVYKGDENNYQRFQELAFQQRIAQQQVAAAQLNQQAAWGWGGPYWSGPYWGWPGW